MTFVPGKLYRTIMTGVMYVDHDLFNHYSLGINEVVMFIKKERLGNLFLYKEKKIYLLVDLTDPDFLMENYLVEIKL